MYSSIFSLAVSDQAVYVGGHFCGAPRLGAVYEGGLTSDFTSTANGCDLNDRENSTRNPDVRDPENAVFRDQMAALDPATAIALEWDPGSNNLLGVFDLTLIDRGLLAGQDGSRFSEFQVGRSGFFDFGVPDDTEGPTLLVTEPVAGTISDSITTISGTVSDNRAIGIMPIRLQNRTTGLWLQADGTFGPEQADVPLTTTETGIGEVAWSFEVSDLPAGDYLVRGFATDTSANTSGPLEHPFTVPGVAECSVVLDETNQPVISYSGFLEAGEDTVFVRRDGRFLSGTTAGSGSFVDDSATPGDHTYAIRWRPAGTVTDVGCSPATITVPQPAAAVACVAGFDANGDPTLSWTAVEGLDRYVVREANLGFVATVNGATTFTDVDRAPGDYSYVIRFRANGANNDLECTPSPITVTADNEPPPVVDNTCVAIAANGGVNITWTPIEGEDAYQVRDDDGFVAGAGNALSFVDTNPQSGTRNYVIRSREAGTVTDVACNSVEVP